MELSQNVWDNVFSGKALIDGIYLRTLSKTHRLHKVKEAPIGKFQCGYYHRQNLPLADKAAKLVHSLLEVGIIQRITSTYVWKGTFLEREFRRTQSSELTEALTLGHVAPLFILFAGMLVFTGVTVIVEFSSGRSIDALFHI